MVSPVGLPAEVEAAFRLLTTTPPTIEANEARQIAREQYGMDAPCKALSGERDANFLVLCAQPVVLKFINASESEAETDLHTQVLAHLAQWRLEIKTPHSIPTLDGKQWFEVELGAQQLRGRAYTFLQGVAASTVLGSAALRASIGRAIGRLDAALALFDHSEVSRVFLWDLMHVTQLAPLVACVEPADVRELVREFMDKFSRWVEPRLGMLPQQFIHGDLSKSNLLVEGENPLHAVAVVDFGDMVYAPRVADLAIAASYQMTDADDPLVAMLEVRDAYESVLPLTKDEEAHLLDLVMARLAQRLLITCWRAERFHDNRAYILRSNPDAQRLMRALMPAWRADIERRFPAAV